MKVKKIKRIICLLAVCAMTITILPARMASAENLANQNAANVQVKDSINSNSFVKANGSTFSVDGKPFYFAGTNNYYLPYAPDYMVDDVFEDAQSMGLKVMRTWGFIDGDAHCDIVLQPNLMEYDEEGFKKFDYVVQKAQESGIKLVIPLINNWQEFGGIDKYVSWTGAGSHDDFYTNEKCKEAYKSYVKHFINRTNSLTGVKYKDDPTIMTWELGNEPRCKSDSSGDTLVNWVEEMTSYIKTLDSNHLVAVGDEGFFNRKSSDWLYCGGEGVDWDRIIALPSVDYGTYHLYPEDWGNQTVEWGTQWIKDHIDAANKVNKPAVLEEFGYKGGEKGPVYKTWGDAVVENGGAGIMFWILTGIGFDNRELYPDYDRFRIVFPSKDADVLTQTGKELEAKNKVNDKLLGDVNGDKEIDLIDYMSLKNYLVNEDYVINKDNSDINGDGEIDLRDLMMLREMI